MHSVNEIASIIAQKAQNSLGASGYFFECIDLASKDYVTQPITSDSFFQIATAPTQQTILFVDGGNNTIIDSPSLHVSALRVAGVIQTNEKLRAKFTSSTVDATVIINLEKKDGKKQYSIMLNSDLVVPNFLPIETNDSLINSVEESRVMQTLCSFVRQQLEWYYATAQISKLSSGSLCILDGSLQTKTQAQKESLGKLMVSAKDHGVVIVGISKSTHLTTTGGYSVSAFLQQNSPYDKMWAVLDCAKRITPVEHTLWFAKLATKSEHVVRIDVPSIFSQIDGAKLLGTLAWISQDATFPGYPYGLIKADDLARISQEEREYLSTRILLSMVPLTQKQIRLLSASGSAHSVLDSLKF